MDCIGEHDRKREEGTEQNVRTKKLVIYPNASMSRMEDDLALVRLREDVKLSPFVRTACLPHSGVDFYVRTGKLSVIAGWGSSQEVRGRLFSFSFILLSFIYLLIFCNRLEFEKREDLP